MAKRVSDWNKYNIPTINKFSKEINLICNYAEFVHEYGKHICEIVCNDEKIISLDIPFLIYKPKYFILTNDKIFGISYVHKTITIYNDMNDAFNEFTIDFSKNFEDTFDDILINLLDKYPNNSFDLFKNPIKIGNITKNQVELASYFEKGFFYKGILWNMNWKDHITLIKDVGFIDEVLKIEIENLTYPHCGYVLLEIESNKILECRKIWNY